MAGCTRLSFTDSVVGWRRLFDACVERAGDHAVALGRRYPVLRAAAARRVVYRTAGQNALVGLVFFVPGADMPVMTLNQIKMVMAIAAIYGEEIGKERAIELAGVVGMGFGFRALARTFMRSTPGIGLVLKASTGYTGTIAVGMAAIALLPERRSCLHQSGACVLPIRCGVERHDCSEPLRRHPVLNPATRPPDRR